MYSDTHFHFPLMISQGEFSAEKELQKMAENKVFFALDIGTKSEDLPIRQNFIQESLNSIENPEIRKKIEKSIYFSAGIWPWPEEIKTRAQSIKLLQKNLENALKSENSLFRKVVAIGECGLDHHWNPSGPDGRCESDFDEELFLGEQELFCAQLELAKKFDLPVIIHSRDAFDETLKCLDKVGYHNGIIHCFSYDLESAKKFLERGWYIALGGAVTYTKKSKMESLKEMISFIPSDRLLLETDAPYLSPVPLRGKINTPNNICHTYKFIAEIRKIQVEDLCQIVDENCKNLFKI